MSRTRLLQRKRSDEVSAAAAIPKQVEYERTSYPRPSTGHLFDCPTITQRGKLGSRRNTPVPTDK